MTTATKVTSTETTAPSGQRCAYQDQNSPQTLRQGIEEYHHVNAAVLADTGSSAADTFFAAHDACHVLFGCDTSLSQEAAVDLWTICGVDISVRDYFAYMNLPEIKQLLRQIGTLRPLWATVKAVPFLTQVFRSARQMRKKWPWQDYQDYLERPLAELREEFNIRVVQP